MQGKLPTAVHSLKPRINIVNWEDFCKRLHSTLGLCAPPLGLRGRGKEWYRSWGQSYMKTFWQLRSKHRTIGAEAPKGRIPSTTMNGSFLPCLLSLECRELVIYLQGEKTLGGTDYLYSPSGVIYPQFSQLETSKKLLWLSSVSESYRVLSQLFSSGPTSQGCLVLTSFAITGGRGWN